MLWVKNGSVGGTRVVRFAIMGRQKRKETGSLENKEPGMATK